MPTLSSTSRRKGLEGERKGDKVKRVCIGRAKSFQRDWDSVLSTPTKLRVDVNMSVDVYVAAETITSLYQSATALPCVMNVASRAPNESMQSRKSENTPSHLSCQTSAPSPIRESYLPRTTWNASLDLTSIRAGEHLP